MPWVLRLVPPSAMRRTSKASALYQSRCANCHRADRKGAPPEYPALTNLNGRITEVQLGDVIRKGSGRMPGFANLGEPAIAALSEFLMDKGDREVTVGRQRPTDPAFELKYTMDGYNKFLDPDGYPGVTPPWGTLTAINLDTGKSRLENAARGVSRTSRTGHEEHRHRESRRRHRDRGWVCSSSLRLPLTRSSERSIKRRASCSGRLSCRTAATRLRQCTNGRASSTW